VNESHDPDAAPPIDFDQTPVPGVPVEFIRYVMTLPTEVRKWFGNFLLDSTMEGFDGTPETSATLWKNELKRRIEYAEAHPESNFTVDQVMQAGSGSREHVRPTAESNFTVDQVMQELKDHIEQLERTPRPSNLHGYHCWDYFGDGWAENGHYDPASHCWLIERLSELHPEQRLGFFAVGGPGVEGVRFGYRYGHHGIWAYYPREEKFVFAAPTLAALIQGWRAGSITV
jgi:hypothetical protein